HSDHHLLHRSTTERVLVRKRRPRRQLDLATLLACPRASNDDTPSSHHEASLCAAPAHRLVAAAPGVLGSAHPLAVLLQERVAGLHALLEHELVEVPLDDCGKVQPPLRLR